MKNWRILYDFPLRFASRKTSQAGKGGAVERRYIARGDLQGDVMFVEKGLKPGERIVSAGGHKVRKGMTVEPAK